MHVTLPNGTRRTARYLGDQGCVTLPVGRDSVSFTPVEVRKPSGGPSKQPWPMGDALPADPLPAGLDAAKVKQAVDAAFEPAAGMTAAFVVTWRGRLVGERYGAGITTRTPLESWSMGKSLTATLMGILVKQGVYDLWQPAPIPEWQGPGDPRAKIHIVDLLQMSSGLRIRAPRDPDYDPSGPYPDHLYLYTGGVNSFHYYLQDGVWNGERILPEGYVKFVSTVAPAWEADKRPVYGAFFWINGDGTLPVPRDAYYMAGAGGQTTLIVPSHDLVVVRLGHYKGSQAGSESLNRALALLMEAVPKRN